MDSQTIQAQIHWSSCLGLPAHWFWHLNWNQYPQISSLVPLQLRIFHPSHCQISSLSAGHNRCLAVFYWLPMQKLNLHVSLLHLFNSQMITTVVLPSNLIAQKSPIWASHKMPCELHLQLKVRRMRKITASHTLWTWERLHRSADL